jgi:hypothetical protein
MDFVKNPPDTAGHTERRKIQTEVRQCNENSWGAVGAKQAYANIMEITK